MRFLVIAATAAIAVVGSASILYAQAPKRTVWDGVYTAAQADHGKALYAANCERCHGSTLQGADVVPPLTGPAFLGDWSGLTVGDLVDRVHTTMPADNPGSISVNTATDIVAYLLQANQFPAGQTALPHIPQVQALIQIVQNKPAGK